MHLLYTPQTRLSLPSYRAHAIHFPNSTGIFGYRAILIGGIETWLGVFSKNNLLPSPPILSPFLYVTHFHALSMWFLQTRRSLLLYVIIIYFSTYKLPTLSVEFVGWNVFKFFLIRSNQRRPFADLYSLSLMVCYCTDNTLLVLVKSQDQSFF